MSGRHPCRARAVSPKGVRPFGLWTMAATCWTIGRLSDHWPASPPRHASRPPQHTALPPVYHSPPAQPPCSPLVPATRSALTTGRLPAHAHSLTPLRSRFPPVLVPLILFHLSFPIILLFRPFPISSAPSASPFYSLLPINSSLLNPSHPVTHSYMLIYSLISSPFFPLCSLGVTSESPYSNSLFPLFLFTSLFCFLFHLCIFPAIQASPPYNVSLSFISLLRGLDPSSP